MFFFRWIREQVRQAILGGFQDAADELELSEPELRARLGLPPSPAARVALPATAADDTPAPAPSPESEPAAATTRAGRRK